MTQPSPVFRLNGGAPGAKASVAASGAVVATLDSTAGVRQIEWAIIGTDETTSAAGYTLVVSGAFDETVSTTALTAGTAAILRCRINGGLGPKGTASTTTIATAKFWVPCLHGSEVGCKDEWYESDPVYGTTPLINTAIRNADAAGAGAVVTAVTGAAPIHSTGGLTPQISIGAATTIAAGSLSAADKTKLDSLTSGAAVASVGATAPITSTGGTTPTIAIVAASGSVPGSMSAADFTKLAGITAGAAVASVSGSAPIVSSGGTTPAISITAASGGAAGSMSAAHYTLVSGATAAATASALMQRDGSGDVAAHIAALNGLTVSDSGATFASDIALTPFVETYAATVTMRGKDGGRHDVTLTGNITFAPPTFFRNGASLEVRVIQGGAGSYTATWSSAAGGFTFPVGLSGTLLATAVADADYFEFKHFPATSSHWLCVAHLKYSIP